MPAESRADPGRPGLFDVFGTTESARPSRRNDDQFLIAQLHASLLVSQASLRLEDDTRLFSDSLGRLLVVADGIGGQERGRTASMIAVNFAVDYLLNAMPWSFGADADDADVIENLTAALERCQAAVLRLSTGNPEREGMATTLTMAYAHWPRLYVVHVGDSRCYLLREGRLEQVTVDQARATESAIGGGSDALAPVAYTRRLRLGDVLLLCTKGVSGALDDAALHAVLARSANAERACRTLVTDSIAADGAADATAVVAYIRDPADAARAGAALTTSAGDPGAAAVRPKPNAPRTDPKRRVARRRHA